MRGKFLENLWVLPLLLFLRVPHALGATAGQEVSDQGHHCWVLEPPGLPPDAPVVFLLHGQGGKAARFKSECENLSLPPCRIVVPDAPIPWDPFRRSWSEGFRQFAEKHLPRSLDPYGYAWYRFRDDREDIVQSRDYLFGLMDRFSKDPPVDGNNPKPRPVILIGFSQGGVMALEAGLNDKGKVRAIVSLSGYIWDPGQTLNHPSLPPYTPILMLHGNRDNVVGEDLHQKTCAALRKAGYHPQEETLAMGHEVTKEEWAIVSKFLSQLKN